MEFSIHYKGTTPSGGISLRRADITHVPTPDQPQLLTRDNILSSVRRIAAEIGLTNNITENMITLIWTGNGGQVRIVGGEDSTAEPEIVRRKVEKRVPLNLNVPIGPPGTVIQGVQSPHGGQWMSAAYANGPNQFVPAYVIGAQQSSFQPQGRGQMHGNASCPWPGTPSLSGQYINGQNYVDDLYGVHSSQVMQQQQQLQSPNRMHGNASSPYGMPGMSAVYSHGQNYVGDWYGANLQPMAVQLGGYQQQPAFLPGMQQYANLQGEVVHSFEVPQLGNRKRKHDGGPLEVQVVGEVLRRTFAEIRDETMPGLVELVRGPLELHILVDMGVQPGDGPAGDPRAPDRGDGGGSGGGQGDGRPGGPPTGPAPGPREGPEAVDQPAVQPAAQSHSHIGAQSGAHFAQASSHRQPPHVTDLTGSPEFELKPSPQTPSEMRAQQGTPKTDEPPTKSKEGTHSGRHRKNTQFLIRTPQDYESDRSQSSSRSGATSEHPPPPSALMRRSQNNKGSSTLTRPDWSPTDRLMLGYKKDGAEP